MKKNVVIIISVIVALAVIIGATIAILVSSFTGGNGKGKDNSSNKDITSSQTSTINGGSDSNSNSNNNKGDKNDNSTGDSKKPSGNTTTVSIGNITASKGDKIKVPVEVSSNQGFMGIMGEIKFDTTALKYTGYKRSSILTDYDFVTTNDSIKFLSVENGDVKDNGTLFYLEFEVISDKTTELTLKIDKGNIGNQAEQLIPVITENGKVTVK